MIYKKNSEKCLSNELFKNPTSEYRGTPFWAWNCKLDKEELKWQIEVFKKMGLGGFHMHVRTGMATPYLSDEYMDIVKACVEKAKEEKMLAWLYDEDRWPSGAAGGLVTKDKKYRARYLLFTPDSYEDSSASLNINDSRSEGGRNGEGDFLAAYDVVLDGEGYLKSYKRIGKDDTAEGTKWYAYMEISSSSSWYNNQAYLDTLSKDAVKRFVKVTHERYKETVGDDFGDAVPAIFTDEPQFCRKQTLNNSTDKHDINLPWTDDIPETYKKAYGDDILDFLPELFWDKKNEVSLTRYRYHDHISERFSEAFADVCGSWCRENGLYLTGHMMEEPSLHSQTAALGEAMRSYRGFDLPGIDMLCNSFEFTTAKQAQSACHQFGREGVLSELYGVTGWDFDFRGHKLQGDWQAALGVTVRVPHLSWVSMAGEAKRDYPASIHYQSPWWKEYSYVEDHFARVYSAMTRGKPVVKVGVIHPVESFWLHWGPNDKSELARDALDEKFFNVTDWLLKGSIDFNFISESLFPTLCEKGTNPLKVGEMEYDAIVVPDCETLRSSTLERLEDFVKNGGKLIFMGSAPEFENAVPSNRGKELYNNSTVISFDREKLLSALEDNRTVTIRYKNGSLSDRLIYQMRQDNDCDWLFVAHACNPYNKDVFSSKDVRIYLDGDKKVTVYDTISGEIYPADVDYANGKTVIKQEMYDYDSLLVKIEDGRNDENCAKAEIKACEDVKIPTFVDYTLDEPNVMLLDMCRFRTDDGEWHDTEEILIADNVAREEAGLDERGGSVPQPWVIPEEEIKHSITLEFTINSEIEVKNPVLALEDAELAEITMNGQKVSNEILGWYVDKSIKKVALPEINKGENIITVKLPLGNRTNTEWCYLLGDFGVKVIGKTAVICKKAEKLAFGDIVPQGFPFYGGNITYHLEAETDKGELLVTVPRYRGGLVKVIIDGEDKGNIVYSPNELLVKGLSDGKHKVDIKLFTHRYNSFGAVHLTDVSHSWHGPGAWREEDEKWSYEYNLKNVGILTTPWIKK